MAKSARPARPKRSLKLVRPSVQLELFPAYVHCDWESVTKLAQPVQEGGNGYGS